MVPESGDSNAGKIMARSIGRTARTTQKRHLRDATESARAGLGGLVENVSEDLGHERDVWDVLDLREEWLYNGYIMVI
jgi:hypothetical protein